MSEEHSEADDLQQMLEEHVSKIGEATSKLRAYIEKVIHEWEANEEQHRKLVETYKDYMAGHPHDFEGAEFTNPSEFPLNHINTIKNGTDQMRNVALEHINNHSADLIESSNIVASSAKRLASIERRIKLQTEEIEANIKKTSVESYPVSGLAKFLIGLAMSFISLITVWNALYVSNLEGYPLAGGVVAAIIGYIVATIIFFKGYNRWDNEEKSRMKGFKELFPEWKEI